MIPRSAGILLHPTSLPGGFGVGDLGPEAARFLDWVGEAGLTLWQTLPLGPTGHGNSPYACHSSFAGNPLLISLQGLAEKGLLGGDAVAGVGSGPAERVDFESVASDKTARLRDAWDRLRARDPEPGGLRAFRAAPEQERWLEDWCLFAALKARHGGRPWWEWGRELRRRETGALEHARRELSGEIEFQAFLQWTFFEQWGTIRNRAAGLGIQIIGDLPIYAARDSADVWANADLFDLDGDGAPGFVAGVPPDYFSATGQLWGNPLYRWERHAATNYAWWVDRARAALRLADLVRLDHFRGFVGYWAVPASEETAVNGSWRPGPGRAIFDALRQALGELPFIAEDLGVITEDVEQLRRSLDLPGMKVLQFAFDSEESPHHADRVDPETAFYTGTHDNDTARGWFRALTPSIQERVLQAVGGTADRIGWSMIEAVWRSRARIAIAPAQDALDLGSEARLNTPGRAAGNWAWRAAAGAFTRERAARLRALTQAAGRAGAITEPARA